MPHVQTQGASIGARQALSQIPDGQIQAPWGTYHPIWTTHPVEPASAVSDTASGSTTTDSHKSTSSPVSESSASQTNESRVQGSMSSAAKTSSTSSSISYVAKTSLTMKPPVSQINDVQIQNPVTTGSHKSSSTTHVRTSESRKIPSSQSTLTSSSSKDSSTSLVIKPPVSQIHDGQIQNPASSSSTQHVTKSTTVTSTTTVKTTHTIKKPANTSMLSMSSTSPPVTKTSGTVVSQLVDGQLQIVSGKPQAWNNLGACEGEGTLSLTLRNGTLKDARGWQGYIAANRQLQFDSPPQVGALITSGFSVCSNGTLALDGSTVFYECLSGYFYNLYDRWIAPQCRPVSLNVAQIVHC